MKISRRSYYALAVFLCLWTLSASPTYAGSPFYLTAERSFSNTEKPQLRLDYSVVNKPMLVRVLRPKNLDRFLDGQFQISRSYEEPITELNPGHYFVSGLNKVESPLRTFRDMLDLEFRKSLQDTSFHEAILETTKGDIVSAPEQIIQGSPGGFALVREYFLDLEYGGNAVNDPGWWFADSAWSEDAYKIRKIALDPLPDGIYLVQAVQGKTEAQCLMQVSSLAVQVKQSTEQLVVRVISREMDPVAQAVVSYRDSRGKWIQLTQKTNEFGEVAFSSPEGILDGKLVVKVQTPDKRQALVDTDFLPAVTGDDSVFVLTDRPIFKPGETFFYKGLVRSFENGELRVPDFAQNQATVTLIRSDGAATDLSAVVPLTDFGSFSGSFGLDEAQTPGIYRLIAEIGGKPHGGEFRVRDYVKPVFYLELIDRSPTVVAGDRFFLKFRAKRYSGGAPKDTKYEVFLYRKKFEAPQWVIESGGGLSAGADYFGEIRSASALTEPKRIFSSVEARLAGLGDLSVANTWDSAPKLDESGEGTFEFDIPKMGSSCENEWIYTLMVRAQDRAGSPAVLTENLYVTLSEAQPVVRFPDTIARVGEKGHSVYVRSTYPDGKPAPRGGGIVDISLEKGREASTSFVKLPFTTNDQGVCRLTLPELSSPGRLIAAATLETLHGRPMKRTATSQPVSMIIGGAQGETVLDTRELELFTSSTILSPGEKAKVFALLPSDWGKSESGTLWETISGRKVYDTRSSAFKGRSRWFEIEARPEYGTGFYHTVTVPMSGGKYREQTLGFRIIPWTRRLNISVFPEREEAGPLKPFRIEFEVKDGEGAVSPDTELAVMIVDRAVYAVQSEIRPGIFDFFYPLPRLDLATFYSDELQGYGYADLLKKPNFRLGALKSQSRLTKKAMRDTAGWFPHVVTDAKGRAAITVDLPANVTEWLITAVAADKAGRVGESNGRFRTVSDISVEVLAPQFLREGEEAVVQIKTVNHLAQSVSVRSGIELAGETLLKAGRLEGDFSLEKQGENILPLTLEAKGDKGEASIRVTLDTEEKVHVGGSEEFGIPLKSAAMKQTFSGIRDGDTLITRLPERGKVGELKVQVSSGLLGAALSAAEVLVSYPFGCTEQLVHTTIPNLVLMDLVKRAGIDPKELGPLCDPLTKAARNASLGIKKIIYNQKTDGGFGLWPSDPDTSLPVTLTALYALQFAKDLKIEGTEQSFSKGLDWVAARIEKGHLAQESTLRGYELAKSAEIGLPWQEWEQQIAYVERVRGEQTSSVEELIYALKIFAAHKDIDWDRFSQRFKDTTVLEELIDRLIQGLEQFRAGDYVKRAGGKSEIIEALGFGFGVPYVVSAGLGVLEDLDALPEELEVTLKQLLLSYMRNGAWISTFNTAQVIFNTREILSREAAAFAQERETGSRTIVVYTRDGIELGKLTPIPAGFVGNFAQGGSLSALSEIRLDGLDPDDAAYSVVSVDVPYGTVRPCAHGLTVERTFRRITSHGSEKLDMTRPLRKGDPVVSEVCVRRGPVTDMGPVPSQFLVVEDGIPSLAQSMDDDEAYLADAGIQPREDTYWSRIKQTQRHPDKTLRIAKVLPGGEFKVYQIWRAAFAGKAAIPPARAFDMYDEGLQGNTEAGEVRVE